MVDFSFVFPTWGDFWTSLIILALTLLFSAFFNHQTVYAKVVNTQRSVLDFLLFWFWLAIIEKANGTPERTPYAVAVGIIFFGYKIAGDWLGFWLRSLQFHPGGVQGWAWAHVLKAVRAIEQTAERHYLDSVRPELDLHERHAEKILERGKNATITTRGKRSSGK